MSVQQGLSATLSLNTATIAGNNYYGSGLNDKINIGNKGSRVYAGEGNNLVNAGNGNNLIYAGAGRDEITTGNGRNTIYAGEGINLVTTGSGNDIIYTGSAGDFINAGAGNNSIYAGEGNNSILSGKGNDLIFAGAGNDTIFSGAGNDTIYAGNGNNLINAGTGDDTVFVGSGKDRIILNGGSGSVKVIGFDVTADKLRLGDDLIGRSLSFKSKGNDTMVYAGRDLLATLVDVKMGSQALVDNGPMMRFQATDLGNLSTDPNGSNVAVAVNAASINDYGQVTGRFNTGATYTTTSVAVPATATTPAIASVVNPNNLIRQTFVWENGTMTAVTSTGTKYGNSTEGAVNGASVSLLSPNVNTISNQGVLLGTADEVRQPVGLPTDRALIWDKSSGSYNLSINSFGEKESYIFDINANGLVSGRNILDSGVEKALAIQNGIITVLADLGGDGGTARGLNGRSMIVGSLDSDGIVDDKVKNVAVAWSKDSNGVYKLTNFGTFGATQAALRDVNNDGVMIGATTTTVSTTVGTITTNVNSNTLFTLDAAGNFKDIGSLGGTTGSVNGINEFGTVVGSSQTASKVNHAFIFSGGVMTDLNNVVGTALTYNGAAVTLTSATSINNFGDVTAIGTYVYKDAAGKDATGTRSFVLKGLAA